MRVSIEEEAAVAVHVECLVGGAQVIAIALQKHIDAFSSVIEHSLGADGVGNIEARPSGVVEETDLRQLGAERSVRANGIAVQKGLADGEELGTSSTDDFG